MSADVTHVTEFGLGVCAGLGKETFREHGLRPDTRACGDIVIVELVAASSEADASQGECMSEQQKEAWAQWQGGSARYIGVDQAGDTILTLHTPAKVPTCPRCAVLRDAALEGRLPVRSRKPSSR